MQVHAAISKVPNVLHVGRRYQKNGKKIVVFRDPEHHFCVHWKLKLQREKLCFQNYLYTCGWGLTVTGAPIHRIASITLSNS